MVTRYQFPTGRSFHCLFESFPTTLSGRRSSSSFVVFLRTLDVVRFRKSHSRKAVSSVLFSTGVGSGRCETSVLFVAAAFTGELHCRNHGQRWIFRTSFSLISLSPRIFLKNATVLCVARSLDASFPISRALPPRKLCRLTCLYFTERKHRKNIQGRNIQILGSERNIFYFQIISGQVHAYYGKYSKFSIYLKTKSNEKILFLIFYLFFHIIYFIYYMYILHIFHIFRRNRHTLYAYIII